MEEKLKIVKTTSVMPSVCMCLCASTVCVCVCLRGGLQSLCKVYDLANEGQKGSKC